MRLGIFSLISFTIHLMGFSLIWFAFPMTDSPLKGGIEVTVDFHHRRAGGASTGGPPPSRSEARNTGRGSKEMGESTQEEISGMPDPAGAGHEGSNLLLSQIRARIERHLRYPILAQEMNLEGSAEVEFQIDEGGEAKEITLNRSTGSEILDREVREAIRRSSPYPLYEKPLTVTISFSADKGLQTE